MRLTSLIAICAIIVMIAAVGCSNNARTTGPVDNTTPTLQLNGNNTNSVRFDNSIANPNVPMDIAGYRLIGFYNYDPQNHCMSLLVGKDNYVELTSSSGNPANIRNGALVRAIGVYNSVPGSHCQLPTSFRFNSIEVIADNATIIPYKSNND
jgi:hypothetical protein